MKKMIAGLLYLEYFARVGDKIIKTCWSWTGLGITQRQNQNEKAIRKKFLLAGTWNTPIGNFGRKPRFSSNRVGVGEA